jgi:PhnB protein
MNLNAYLHFNGNCEEAFKFYEKAFGVKTIMKMSYGEAPPGGGPTPPGFEKKIMHTRIQVGNTMLMGSDAPPERFHKPQGFSVNIDCQKPEEADKVFQALSDGAQIVMPIQKTFWADRFGMLIDKFGTSWMVNCETQR